MAKAILIDPLTRIEGHLQSIWKWRGAARAGEAGKGFAVVAQEVRNLAQRAGEAARNTGGLIENTVTKIEEYSTLVRGTSERFAEVSSDSALANELVEGIAEASHRQAEGIEQMKTALSEMDTNTRQNAAQAQELTTAMAIFKTDGTARQKDLPVKVNA